jgi:hypothetical protein
MRRLLRHDFVHGMFQKEFYNGIQIPNVTVRGVLRKRLHLKEYKLSIVQGVEYGQSVRL